MSKHSFDLHQYSSVESTNDTLKTLEPKEWTVVAAKEQTKGRGRKGRVWESTQGGLYFSILLLPTHLERIQLLTLSAGVALCQTCSAYKGIKPRIKWPNDILIEGKKVAGILTESVLGEHQKLIVGIGVNLNQKTPPLPETTSLFLENGTVVEHEQFLNDFLSSFKQLYLLYQEKEFDALLGHWRKWDCVLGKSISLHTESGIIEGTAQDISSDGFLLLETNEGKQEIVQGDVTLRL